MTPFSFGALVLTRCCMIVSAVIAGCEEPRWRYNRTYLPWLVVSNALRIERHHRVIFLTVPPSTPPRSQSGFDRFLSSNIYIYIYISSDACAGEGRGDAKPWPSGHENCPAFVFGRPAFFDPHYANIQCCPGCKATARCPKTVTCVTYRTKKTHRRVCTTNTTVRTTIAVSKLGYTDLYDRGLRFCRTESFEGPRTIGLEIKSAIHNSSSLKHFLSTK